MRKCRHCRHKYDSTRAGKRLCPNCGLPDKQKCSCAICGALFFKSPTRKSATCSTTCSSTYRSLRCRKHGESRTRLHNIWCGMKSRCNGANSVIARRYYQDRGITCCREWRESYQAFRSWSLANGYRDDLEIDRRDNDKGYSPSNCRWATRKQQMHNTKKRCNGLSKYRGVGPCGKHGKFRAVGSLNGRPIHIGVFRKERQAAKAYDLWAKRNLGELASLNFSD